MSILLLQFQFLCLDEGIPSTRSIENQMLDNEILAAFEKVKRFMEVPELPLNSLKRIFMYGGSEWTE